MEYPINGNINIPSFQLSNIPFFSAVWKKSSKLIGKFLVDWAKKSTENNKHYGGGAVDSAEADLPFG